jgi:manganese transport protein
VAATQPLVGRRIRARAAWPLLGPAFVAAVAYVDPGNVATNVTAGATYGYRLLWVLVVANLMAFVVQYLSAKLGLVTGRSLPEAVRDTMPRGWRLLYWGQAEVVAAATDLAEVIGGAIALNLLFGVPLLIGGLITGAISTALLAVQSRFGQRPFERLVVGLLLIIGAGFVAGVFVAPPSWSGAATGLLPTFAGSDSLLLAAGMLGATVMPHVVYLHSALARDRHGVLPGRDIPRFLAATRVDVGAAMLIAGAVNIAMLLVAAATLRGLDSVETIGGAHQAIGAELGQPIAILFAVGLLASGLASTSVGCYAGAVIMDGLLRVRIALLARRLVTLVPALVILVVGVDPTLALVGSQVVLSFGIPFALVPLVRLTAKRELMGEHVNRRVTTLAAWLIAAVVIVLNGVLLVLTFLTPR